MLELIQDYRKEILLMIVTIIFIKTATAFPATQPAWSLVAFMLLGFTDYWYVVLKEEEEPASTK